MRDNDVSSDEQETTSDNLLEGNLHPNTFAGGDVGCGGGGGEVWLLLAGAGAEQEAAPVTRHLLLHVEDEGGLLAAERGAVAVRDEALPHLLVLLADHVHPVVLRVQHVHHLHQGETIIQVWTGLDLNSLFASYVLDNVQEKKESDVSRLTCPRLTSSSSSTQGRKSCMTTILLSGRNPFSFSMPTLTSVSMEALPVMRPITGSPPPPPPRRDSSSSAEMRIIQVLEYLNEK